jgi:energy-coupling factor transport system ATP-binding protein
MEIAEAAALGDLAAAMCVITRLVPAGDIGTLLAAFPLAVLGYRRRARVCSIAVTTAFTVAFLGGGIYPAASAVAAGALGSLIGIGLRRGWSVPRIVGTGALTIGVPAAAIAVGAFSALTDLRVLALAQLRNAWDGVARLGEAAGLPRPVLDVGQGIVLFAVSQWWLLLLVLVTVGVLVWVVVATWRSGCRCAACSPCCPGRRWGILTLRGFRAPWSPRCRCGWRASVFAMRARRPRPWLGST